ncbi:hypothetical protein Taro_033024 [Colocasia esculenta]|uniref:RNase H type-1 domain-containing protein n=1 Tax=Colocasia esculenta TaxID=4460 RepID=A0A843VST9_COLES|nr:hypothetical protein [Colocasia esculenta]
MASGGATLSSSSGDTWNSMLGKDCTIQQAFNNSNTSEKENLKVRSLSIVKWLMPPPGQLKLNVDGAFKITSGEAGGGGILRDYEGNMCWAFTRKYYGLNSSLAAEALALRDGLSIYCNKGVTEVLVETDSLNLLQIVTKQISCPWDFACIMQHIAAKTQLLEAEITHTPREDNREKVLQKDDVPPFDDARMSASVGVLSGELRIMAPVEGLCS